MLVVVFPWRISGWLSSRPGQEGLLCRGTGYPKSSWLHHGSPKLRSELGFGGPLWLRSPRKRILDFGFFSSSSVLLYFFIFSVWNPCCRTSGIPSSGRWQRRDSWHQGLVRFNFLNLIGREKSEKLPCATFFSISVALQQTNIAIEKRTIYR